MPYEVRQNEQGQLVDLIDPNGNSVPRRDQTSKAWLDYLALLQLRVRGIPNVWEYFDAAKDELIGNYGLQLWQGGAYVREAAGCIKSICARRARWLAHSKRSRALPCEVFLPQA